MDRRTFVGAIASGGLAAGFPSFAQSQRRIWRIGMLETISAAKNAANLDALRQGLKEVGYVEGRNLTIEYRSADGLSERFTELASELVSLKVDLIVTRGTPATIAAKNITQTIPIVMAAVGDPVDSGLVRSLARPGGNITGLSSVTTEIDEKRLALLREVVPSLSRVGLLLDTGSTSNQLQLKVIEAAARSLGVQRQLLDVSRPEDLAPAFDAAVRQRVDGLVVWQDVILQENRTLIAELAAKHRLPAIYRSMEFIEAGGLMAYGPSYPDLYRRAASYVHKILRGAKPADLPIEQPTTFELIINLKVATALQLKISQALLLRADRVVE
jgi:putative ABC transport system substrate-binding protein